ncbi:hypothetical protein ElyMa_002282500 [Elysia marginata]|uniref:Uncharacterized protein n=1 Tax=Elysia marginata TaxID=1093978 RepID=A0AAV4G107_9GAST|nr:hypothetical protein ElyMa_002282500 [Elysia marginata]
MMNEVKEIGRTVKSIEGKVEIHEGILSGLSEKVEKKMTEYLPYEVRQARKQSNPEMLEAERAGKAAWQACPASRLVIDGEKVKAMAPWPRQMTT